LIPSEWLDQAVLRITPHTRSTLLTNDAELNIYLKWESRQITGSFKARGALNKVLSLEPWESAAGLVTASAGNHGQGVALAGRKIGAPVLVFASNHAVPAKIKAMQQLGAEVHLVEGGYNAAEGIALNYAAEHKKTWISAYNDGQVIAGQGTIGLEIAQDLMPESGQTWVVPVGGGGLISGIGAALDRFFPRPHLVGVNPQASSFMHSLYHRGSQDDVPDLPTLADGLSGAVENESLTIPMVKKYVNDMITVTEDEIGYAVVYAWKKYGERIEGSAAAALAAVITGKVKPPAVVVISGGNIQPEVHEMLCQKYPEAG
jgi:threonine dehydratase